MGHKPRKLRSCSICRQLKPCERAAQKYGFEDYDTHLPEATRRLQRIEKLWGTYSRPHELWRCPECRTYYYYFEDYEFIANGSEDEQTLRRISDDEANKLLAESRSLR